MKWNFKTLFFLLTLLFCHNIYGQNNDMFSFGIAEFGFGYNVSKSETKEFEITMIPLNLFLEYPDFFENHKARIGIEFYPFELRILPIMKSAEMSFINTKLFFDFLGPRDKDDWDYLRIGPFVSVNWLFIHNLVFDFDKYLISSGLRIEFLGYTESILRFQLADIEIGYRNSRMENKFYALVKFNIMDLFILPYISKEFIDRMFVIK
ncbi:MAG: hypothetical protein LBD48_11455 [Treponema sp.]|jgi:hypothetical protein|nr:hypothetical protein [Treponema sp.]